MVASCPNLKIIETFFDKSSSEINLANEKLPSKEVPYCKVAFFKVINHFVTYEKVAKINIFKFGKLSPFVMDGYFILNFTSSFLFLKLKST